MNKKLIIIAAAVGLVSFAGMFAYGWLTKKPAQAQQTETGTATPVQPEPDLTQAQSQISAGSNDIAADATTSKAMTEKQLKNLITEMREKIQDYNYKLQDIDIREHRMQMTQETLKKDIEELENLRIELASTVARLKNEQDMLLKSRVEISKTEKDNLALIAAAYDKMDSASAGKILTTMGQAQNNNSDDAVKILYYMPERSKAKILASIAETEPAISAYFCQKLKQITEKE
jgi:flagellar motility protein MotE (MotC chaperone)